MTGPRRRPRALRLAAWGLAGLLVLLGGFIALRWGTGNQGAVVPGKVYRSGQLTAAGLERAIRAHGIKSVLNLRGSNPDEPWYRTERAATLASGATQIDVAMASDLWLTRDQARALVEILDTCPKPVLLHCQWGAERSGLVAAMAELLRPGGSPATAQQQFTPYYLFLPIKDGLVMQAHVDRYAHWLGATGQPHSPATFRRWIAEEYRPESPSRAEWPYDPYPLAVYTRPPDDRAPASAPVRQTARPDAAARRR